MRCTAVVYRLDSCTLTSTKPKAEVSSSWPRSPMSATSSPHARHSWRCDCEDRSASTSSPKATRVDELPPTPSSLCPSAFTSTTQRLYTIEKDAPKHYRCSWPTSQVCRPPAWSSDKTAPQSEQTDIRCSLRLLSNRSRIAWPRAPPRQTRAHAVGAGHDGMVPGQRRTLEDAIRADHHRLQLVEVTE